jgi:hypothetical protein
MIFSSEAQQNFTEIICAECGITFAVPEVWRKEKQRTGDGWFCPNGHCRAWVVDAPIKLEIVKNG